VRYAAHLKLRTPHLNFREGNLVNLGRLVLVTVEPDMWRMPGAALAGRGYRVRIWCAIRGSLPAGLAAQVEVVPAIPLRPAHWIIHAGIWRHILIHNMASGRNYYEKEIESAVILCKRAGAHEWSTSSIWAGLARPGIRISVCICVRAFRRAIPCGGQCTVTEFRASLIIGSGSISFEMIRYLTEQFPLVFGPPWMHNAPSDCIPERVGLPDRRPGESGQPREDL